MAAPSVGFLSMICIPDIPAASIPGISKAMKNHLTAPNTSFQRDMSFGRADSVSGLGGPGVLRAAGLRLAVLRILLPAGLFPQGLRERGTQDTEQSRAEQTTDRLTQPTSTIHNKRQWKGGRARPGKKNERTEQRKFKHRRGHGREDK